MVQPLLHPRRFRRSRRALARRVRGCLAHSSDLNCWLPSNGRLYVPYVAKVDEIGVRWSRDLPSLPSSVTIVGEPDGRYYARFVIDAAVPPPPTTGQEAGGGCRYRPVADTDSHHRLEQLHRVANPKHPGRKLGQASARFARDKSRRQKGSASRDKTRLNVTIAHNEVARARRDHHHKQTAQVILAAAAGERLNACGAPVSPPTTREARDDEAGSAPTAVPGEHVNR